MYRRKLIEALADTDDSIMEAYLEGQDVKEESIIQALRQATLQQKVVPVLCGSAFKNKGVQPLLDAIVRYLPAPTDVPPIEGKNSSGETKNEVPTKTPPLPPWLLN